MAQYFQVLSQGDNLTSEDLGRFCSNIVENQATVQYVISQPTDQTFQQGQQILLSSDPVVLVDGQPQQIIVDQSQVALSNQYVLQDANIEFQDARTQQIFYMDNSNNVARVDNMVEEPVAPPVVLNHHLHQSPLLTNIVGAQAKNMPVQRPLQHLGQTSALVNRQILPQVRGGQVGQQVRSPMVQPARTPLLQQVRPPLNQQQKLNQQSPVQQQADAPRLINSNVRNKTPNLQFNNSNQEQSFKQQQQQPEKKAPSTVLNQMKLLNSQGGQQSPKRKPPAKPAVPKSRIPKPPKVAAPSTNFSSGVPPQPRQAMPRPPRPVQRTTVPQHIGMPRSPMPPVQQPQQQQQQLQQVIQSPQVVHQQQQMLQQQQQQQVSQIQQQNQQLQLVHNQNYVIQPPIVNQTAQQQVTLPAFVHSSQIKAIIESTPVTEEYTDSIRMLVILSNGEQRLITFTLPKEPCTIQEILEQVGLPISHDTIIKCTETHSRDINYIVHVSYQNPQASAPQTAAPQPNNAQEVVKERDENPAEPPAQVTAPEPPPKLPSPEPPKELPKLIPGKLAVCVNCGYLSEDFNRCLRCKRRLPDDVKSVNVGEQPSAKKSDGGKQPSQGGGGDKLSKTTSNGSANSGQKSTQSPARRRPAKAKLVEPEPVILTLSSDEEEKEESETMANLKFIESQVVNSENKKEPTMLEIQQWETRDTSNDEVMPQMTTSIHCRTIRIGSYRFVPADNSVLVGTSEFVIKVPLASNPKEYRTITVPSSKIVRVLANFQKILPVIFVYVTPTVGNEIRQALGMEKGTEYYFDPMAKEEAYKRITILPEFLGDEAKSLFKQMYGPPRNVLEELNAKEANTILLKTCPKEMAKSCALVASGFPEVKQLLIYPPGKGGLSINTEDYLCLAQDQFLNDVIIDFYIKYLILQLPQEQQEKVHVFSNFFYKRLTTKPASKSRRCQASDSDVNLTAAEKRHARVKNWTKNVNLFEKDFIIVPINESCHWFLAIICFPGLDGCYTMEGKPFKLESIQKKNVKKKTIHAISITQIKAEKIDNLLCDPEDSDKDEAEGDDSEPESEEDTEEQPKSTVAPAIKQPCVLIFDSLAGASRSRVVATLREYLSCEYKIKMNSERIFNKDSMKYGCPKVPQQTNFTDCGLYLLQYVESFFKTPIKSYQLPMHELKTWFDELTATKKREDIALLIKELMVKYHKDVDLLPEIELPTRDGKLIANEEEMEEEEENGEEDKASETSTVYMTTASGESESQKSVVRLSGMSLSQSFEEAIANAVKPDTSEVKKQSNRETLSYLKAKRIVRHKSSDGSEAKKFKSNDVPS